MIPFSCLNGAVEVLYKDTELQNQFFCGKIPVELGDMGMQQVSWSWKSVPVIGYAGDEAGKIVIKETEFLLDFGKSSIAVILDVFCTVSVGDALRFQVGKVQLDVSQLSAVDKVLVSNFIEPPVRQYIMEAVNRILENVVLSVIRIQGVSFFGFSATVNTEEIIISGSMEKTTGGTGQITFPVVKDQFQCLLSRRAVAHMINLYAKQYIGYHTSTGGEKGFKVGTASYKCGVEIEDISVSASGSETCIQGNVRLKPSASAEVKVVFIPIGISYTGATSPASLPVEIVLKSAGNSIRAEIKSIGGFTMVLTPSGSVDKEILSSIVWPLSEIMVNSLIPLARDMLREMKLMDIPVNGKSFTIAGTKWNAALGNIKVYGDTEMLGLIGAIKIGRKNG